MPWRPASLAPEAAAPRRRRSDASRAARRILLIGLLAVLLAPPALLLVYRLVPVPITPLMVIRLIEGEGLRKDWVPLGAIAPALPRAVVAAEDNRFCAHFGFDWQELGGQIDALLTGERARGASTITMQTAKNLFLWPGRDFLRKALEAVLTPQIELLWPKRRIVEVYLNVAEFGPGIYGAEAAARAYFAKPAEALGTREAALLAAVLPSPRASSPARPTAYLERRARTIRTRIDQLGPMLDCLGPA
jgi:monofunctional biosynthetic peptidoglycan transglycosylase